MMFAKGPALFLISLIIFGLSFSRSSLADSSVDNLAGDFGNHQVLSLPEIGSSRNSEINGTLRMENIQYLTALADNPDLNSTPFLSAQIGYRYLGVKSMAFADIVAGSFVKTGRLIFFVNEVFYEKEISNQYLKRVSVGRKKAFWSELDKSWTLGLWQPVNTIDPLRIETQGLMGFHFDFEMSPDVKTHLLVSPLFIPSLGPEVREDSGALISDNRWYRAPSQDYDFNSRINRISYKLDIPTISKLVTQPTLALHSEYRSFETGFFIQGALGYKPVNELILKRSAFKQTSSPQVDVTVIPDVAIHQIASMDIGFSTETTRNTFSILADSPRSKLAEKDGSIQGPQAMQAVGVTSDFNLSSSALSQYNFQASYLKIFGGRVQDVNEFGQPDDFTIFDRRFRFYNSGSFKVENNFGTLFKRPSKTRLKYSYDFDQRGSMVSTEFQFFPQRAVALIVGADLLSVSDEKVDPNGFLNQFRANDRFYGGLNYVF